MKKVTKKLTLNPESIRVLDAAALARAGGGGQGGTTDGGTIESRYAPSCAFVNTCNSCGTCTSNNCNLSAFFSCWCASVNVC